MRERPNRHAWKACVGQPTVGSNPTPSAGGGRSCRVPAPWGRHTGRGLTPDPGSRRISWPDPAHLVGAGFRIEGDAPTSHSASTDGRRAARTAPDAPARSPVRQPGTDRHPAGRRRRRRSPKRPWRSPHGPSTGPPGPTRAATRRRPSVPPPPDRSADRRPPPARPQLRRRAAQRRRRAALPPGDPPARAAREHRARFPAGTRPLARGRRADRRHRARGRGGVRPGGR